MGNDVNIYNILKNIDRNNKKFEEDYVNDEQMFYSNSIVNYGEDEEALGLC